ncbi:S9 family peptidase [Actinacidiphila rubida]|uniref:Dipeptidyl aminopeptidase/acylaminoacyl peptidase n=1 Tax=Actinacidiphila rubida TaxID=310780 RepID=A0A1H8PWZ6_9ACTN|nr:prolyl oligopeptidase family serine peptidase [Actinacidiphila rubida]SEO46053.1 Dipeptidyl aminopeptidase/acylaminoacyl peptidase [Actinacidiphila rubida]
MSEGVVELTAELLVDSAEPRCPVISPDGAWVAYVVASAGRGPDPVSALWVAAADGGSPPREAARGTACEGVPRWAPDSASLFFRSDGQLHRVGLDGSRCEALTAWRGGIVDHWPLAGGELVAVIAADEPSEQDERRQAARDDAIVWGAGAAPGRLRLLHLGTRELRVLAELGDRHVVEVVQRPDGGPLAVVSWSCPQFDPGVFTAELHVIDPATGALLDLGRTGLLANSPIWWSVRDVWRVAYLAVTPPGLVGGLAVFDVALPEPGAAPEEHRNLTAGMDVCPTELVQVGNGTPLALFADGLDTAIYRLDPEVRRFVRVFTRDGRVDALTASSSGEAVAALASTAYEPGDVHCGPPGGPLVRLSDTGPDLRRVRWGTQERLSYKAGDGLDLDGLLILPVDRSRQDGPFPLITLVHGGPYDRYRDDLNTTWFSAQWLATAGYAVFLPNPRGGQGHGHAFAAAVAGRVGLEEWTDILTGIDLLVADGVADPDRLGIDGWSHGGFMAAWAVGQTDRFKAALVGAGVTDWGMQAATGEEGVLESGLGGSVGWEGPGPHLHDRRSPVSFASKVTTPVLILHGQDDTNVPLGQATYFHRALCRFGVAHEFVVYPREGHLIMERTHRIDVLRRTRAWFGRWLGAPASDGDPI